MKLPIDIKVTIVTGMNRIGTPMEIFDKNGRYKVKPLINLKEVIIYKNDGYYDFIIIAYIYEVCVTVTSSSIIR